MDNWGPGAKTVAAVGKRDNTVETGNRTDAECLEAGKSRSSAVGAAGVGGSFLRAWRGLEVGTSRSEVVGAAGVGESFLRAWRGREPGSGCWGSGIAHVFVRPGLDGV